MSRLHTRLRPLLLCAAVLAAAPVVGAVPTAHAQDNIEDRDRLGETVRSEAEAIRELARVIRADVEAGNVTLTEAAEGKWAQGVKAWESIRSLGKEGEYGQAFKEARRTRAAMREAFREAFEGSPSSAVTDALRAYVDVLQARVDAVERQCENFEVTDKGREHYLVSAAMYKDAKKAAKKKKWAQAFRHLVATLSELDKAIYEVYPKAR